MLAGGDGDADAPRRSSCAGLIQPPSCRRCRCWPRTSSVDRPLPRGQRSTRTCSRSTCASATPGGSCWPRCSSVELLEVQLVNAVAPFVLNARLKPLMLRTPERDKHIVNVSAVEGQFYRRFKTTRHPHTNMAKAALNMMTRTSAADYCADGIHMNASTPAGSPTRTRSRSPSARRPSIASTRRSTSSTARPGSSTRSSTASTPASTCGASSSRTTGRRIGRRTVAEATVRPLPDRRPATQLGSLSPHPPPIAPPEVADGPSRPASARPPRRLWRHHRPKPDVVTRDSAGVTIVETNRALWGDSMPWTVDTTPMLAIGQLDGEEPYLFEWLVGALRLDDGSIIAADGSPRKLRQFDSTGRFVRAAGRSFRSG